MKKVVLFLLLFVASTIFLGAQNSWNGTSNPWTQGDGTESSPYLIETAEHLAYLAEKVNSGNDYSGEYFKLTNNLNLGGPGKIWIPIGNGSNLFKGNFDGNGYEIDNMHISVVTNYAGLFGYTENGTISNLGIGGNSSIVGNENIGAIAGRSSHIDNCYNRANVSGNKNVGGITGISSTVTNCYNTGNVSGKDNYVGGIMGSGSNIVSCYNIGSISGKGINVGTVAGNVTTNENCYGLENKVSKDEGIGWGNGNNIGQSVTTNYMKSDDIITSLNRDAVNKVWFRSLGSLNNGYPVLSWQRCTITVNAGDGGTATGGGTFAYNTEIELIATADDHHHFVKWNDDNTDNPRMVTVIQNITYTAIFAIDQHTITIEESENGSVNCEEIVEGNGTFNYGTEIELTATADVNYHFVKWNDDNTDNPRNIIVTEDATYTAIFAIDQHTITIGEIENGSVSCEEIVNGSGTFDYGTEIELTAIPNVHYHFVKWSDGNTDNPRTIIVTANATYTAEFAIDQHTITVLADENGTVNGGGRFDYGTTATFSAIANTGHHFVKWNDGNTDNPRDIVVTENATYIAEFAISSYYITVNSNANGTVEGQGSYVYNTTATLTATADEHYHFVKWDDDNTDNPRTITVTKDTTYTAEFKIDQHTITVSTNGNGIVNGGEEIVDGTGTFDYGTEIELTATPNDHYHFVKWSDDNTDNPRTITVVEDATYTAIYEINSYRINVYAGQGGTVSGSGTFVYEAEITITAKPNAGHSFVKWDDGNTDNPRIVTVDGTATYIAEFKINSYTVVVDSNEGGTVSGDGIYVYNTTATLAATADEHHHFVKWNDDNTDNPRTVVVIEDITYTATFAIDQHTITANGDNNGTVEGGGIYDYGTEVELTAIPNEGYHFVKWDDDEEENPQTENPRTVTVNEDTTYTAVFAINTYIVNVEESEGGSIDCSVTLVEGSGIFDYGTKITLTATADPHYSFTKWSDNNTDNPREIIVAEDATYTAVFTIDQHLITVIAGENGKVEGSGKFDYNSKVIIAATADKGYHFVKWNDGNTDNPRTITVLGNADYTAEFAISSYYITVKSDGNGSVEGEDYYVYNTTATLAATADEHYHFVKWNDDNTDNPRTITVTEDATYTAEFAIDQHTIVVEAGENGSVNGGGIYDYNSTATLTATANKGHHFVKWSDGNTENPRTITVTEDKTYTAEFAISSYSITVNSNGNGKVEGEGSYVYNTTATLTATANEHYHFVKWNDNNTDNPRTVTVTENATYTAEFTINSYNITVNANEGGSVSGNGTYVYNTSTTLIATADEHYHFVKWSDGSIINPRTVTIKGDATYTAEFAKDTHTIIVNAGIGGIVAGQGTFDYDSEITLTATPNTHYHFLRWSDGNTDNPRTVKVIGNATYTAEFEINSYTINVESNDGGTVSGQGTYVYSSTVTLAATPNEHYHFVKWNDGNTNKIRTITVTENTTYTAEFEINSYLITVNAGIGGTVSGDGIFKYGSEITLTATADAHYHFVKWNDGNTDNPRNVTVSRDITYTAQFAINSYSITVNSNEGGSVTGSGDYNYNTTATLTATPNAHYQFVKWSDGNTSNPRNITVTSDATYTAEFKLNSYLITVNAESGGTVAGGGIFNYGSSITLTATPNDHYHFVQWNDGNTDNPRTVTVERDATYVAQFAINSYTITINNGVGGIATGGGTYLYNTTAILTATANIGYHFVKWSDGNNSNPRNITVTENATYTAEFAINQHTISVNAGIGGTATGGGVFDYGTSATLTATANEGYHFVKWSDGNVNNPYTVTVMRDASFTAEFAKNNYTIVATADENGKISPAGETTITYNASITYTISPDAKYEIEDVLVDGVSVLSDIEVVGGISRYTFTNVDANHTIHAKFREAVGVNEIENTKVKIYSFAKTINISIDNDIEATFEVIDLSGRVVFNETFTSTTSCNIDMSGVYVVRVINNGMVVATEKVIIK